ncbi:MAG: hypothetical protein DI563_30545 [Variovorax paradoxus]|uniref:Uncharacterized protein n=1 Tax=Variovorax paradoxus TaxID=34073 RepID=A0A2W5NZ63_VARPD|nr:MAG: hypothetical protein DI563_30545 [Variovorax paradoxus]
MVGPRRAAGLHRVSCTRRTTSAPRFYTAFEARRDHPDLPHELGLDCSGRRIDFVCAAEDALRLRIPDEPLAAPADWTLGHMCSVIDEVMSRDGVH